MSHPAISRAHSLVLVAGADTANDLAAELRFMAQRIEQGNITEGCSGGPSCGSTYSYRVSPEQTHAVYFKQIDEWLAAERAKK